MKPEGLLPKGAPNPIVWCERCQRYHREHTFMEEDWDRYISEAAQKLCAAIDAEMVKKFGDGK